MIFSKQYLKQSYFLVTFKLHFTKHYCTSKKPLHLLSFAFPQRFSPKTQPNVPIMLHVIIIKRYRFIIMSCVQFATSWCMLSSHCHVLHSIYYVVLHMIVIIMSCHHVLPLIWHVMFHVIIVISCNFFIFCIHLSCHVTYSYYYIISLTHVIIEICICIDIRIHFPTQTESLYDR